ncbi:MAG: DUF2851 family protein [Bacteroidota bacterium]
MTEDFLYYIWQFRLFDTSQLRTTSGEPVHILNYGIRNTNSGPDFSNARIRIGSYTFAGQVEIHTYSSEWLQHKHHLDNAYRNVILHVVYEHDASNIDEQRINKPTIQLKGVFNEHIWSNYLDWLNTKREIPCGDSLRLILPQRTHFWLERLFIERLSDKVTRIRELFDITLGNKEEIAYRLLLRYFGRTVHAPAYEQLSVLLPYKHLMKHSHQPVILEALLLGVSGFLKISSEDPYINTLQSHYVFYKDKYQLEEMDASVWKLLRMRPVAFPGHRLAQLAVLLQQTLPLYSRLASIKSFMDFESLFDFQLSTYWKNHYHLGIAGNKISERPGIDFIRNLFINVVIPLVFFESDWSGNDDMKERAVYLADQLPAEDNRITRMYHKYGLHTKTASESQALVQLYNHYCTKKKCLSCAFGHDILKD